jgi:hypothetical protein
MISQSFIRFRALARMIMSVDLNCGFEFEKGNQFLICMHNKASSVAALCGYNPNWSAFVIRSRHRAAIPSIVAEIFDDDLLYGGFLLTTLEITRALGAFRSACLPHRKRESQRTPD